MTLNEQLADLGTRMLEWAVSDTGQRRDVLIEGAATLRTLAATLAEVPDPRLTDQLAERFGTEGHLDYRSDLAEALGIDYDEGEVPDSWAGLLDRVERLVHDRRDAWQAAHHVAETADRYRKASGAPALATEAEVAARIADRAQLVSTLARSLGVAVHPDLPAAVTVAVANLKAHRDELAKQLANPSAARVLKALGTWSPGHEDMDTAELADAAVHVAGELAGDREQARAQVRDLTAERRRIAVALGLESGALVSTMHQVVAQLRTSAEDSPDGLADRIAEALGRVSPDRHPGDTPAGVEWTDESLAWLVDQVEDMRDQLHRAVVGAGDARTKAAELAERLERMTTDRDAERDERQVYLRGLRAIASEQAGGELITDEGIALVRRIAGIVAALVRLHNEAVEREAALRATVSRQAMDRTRPIGPGGEGE